MSSNLKYLVDHALTNLWCTPDQDNQIILNPAKITPNYGVYNSWKFMWTVISLPEQNTKFHIYQIGQVYPVIIDLFPKLNEWLKLSDACNLASVVCDLYTANGIELPRTESYYIVTDEKNVLIAVKENSKIAFNPLKDKIFLRAYRNAYFNSIRASNLPETVKVNGGTMATITDIIALQNEFDALVAGPGDAYAFCNGYKINTINLSTVHVGDTVEYVFDASIYAVVDFRISNLGTFDSILDNKGKYLLHYDATNLTCGTEIDYRDDIDVFIIDGVTQKGIYYHKNTDDTLRMVTHKDYSVPVISIVNYLLKHSTVIDNTNAYIRLHIRNSGYTRPLINECNRIKELYKLTDVTINRTLLGLDSTVSNWKAVNLENSNYTKTMGVKAQEVTNTLVTGAYGYNAVSKLVADNPVRAIPISNQNVVQVPYLFQTNSTGFEYTATGLLLNWYYHNAGDIYVPRNNNCGYVEFLSGNYNNAVDDHYNAVNVSLNIDYDYRFYIKPSLPINGSTDWQDVTGGSYYSVTNNVAHWLVDDQTLIRSNRNGFVSSMNFELSAIPLTFNLAHLQTINGVTQVQNMKVPMGELDVFLNGKTLIKDLDYYLNFPIVTIVNKEYLIQNTTQTVVARFTGLCNNQLQLTPIAETGYVRNGIISYNNRYNIRDDKVIRLCVNGELMLLNERGTFTSENNDYFTYSGNLNGKPYIVFDTVVPVKSLTNRDTYEYRKESQLIDKSISDYLTVKKDSQVITDLNTIPDYYKLYSPFICKILFDLKNGILTSPIFTQQYNDDQIRELVEPYVYLIHLDPIYIDNVVNREYVAVHPHNLDTVVTINALQYTFLRRVVGLYCRGLVDLSPNVTIA